MTVPHTEQGDATLLEFWQASKAALDEATEAVDALGHRVAALPCGRCRHRFDQHTGVGPGGHNAPCVACRVEVDRYEVCACSAFVPVPSTKEKRDA